MPDTEKKTKCAPDRPTPFMVYLISLLIAAIVILPACMGFFYLLDLSYFAEKTHEMVVVSGMITGGGLSVVAGAVFGYFAQRQITDKKE